MIKPELLLPAGNIEKMKYAFEYGADAVYLGISDYSLRNNKKGEIISSENILNAIQIGHKNGKKVYVTINIYPNNSEISKLPAFLEILNNDPPDSIIFSDIGVGSVIKKYLPKVDLHLSTQANVTNYESAKAWQDFGVSRVILARELSLQEISQIIDKVPGIEFETFVHGSLCISYSGRCLLSDYTSDNKRKSNEGGCTQSCRWKYSLLEERRPGEYFEINEDEHGSYIMNSKDLCLVEYLKDLLDIGVQSFKIEGRTKSLYYVAVVTKVYREVIDKIFTNQQIDFAKAIQDLATAGNRGFTTNFLLDKPTNADYNYNSTKSVPGLKFLATTLSDTMNDGRVLIRTRNQIKNSELVEWITPNSAIDSRIDFIQNSEGELLEIVHTNNEVYVNAPKEISDYKWAILRSKG